MAETNDIYTLIIKVISGNANTDEVSRLQNWLIESGDHLKIYEDSINAWHTQILWVQPATYRHQRRCPAQTSARRT